LGGGKQEQTAAIPARSLLKTVNRTSQTTLSKEHNMTLRVTRLNYMVGLAMAIWLGLLVGCSGSSNTTPTSPRDQTSQQLYKSPEDVFNVFMTAAEKDDWKAACECMTDETRDQLAAGLVLIAGFAEGFAKTEAEKARFKPLLDVLAKHLPAPAQKEEKPKPANKFDTAGAEDFEKAMMKSVEGIKDRNAFIADMMTVLKQVPDGGMANVSKSQLLQYKNAKVEELKIHGDTATGFAVAKRDGQEARQPIGFKKVGEGWKIELKFKDKR
jgi:hypothetical protein